MSGRTKLFLGLAVAWVLAPAVSLAVVAGGPHDMTTYGAGTPCSFCHHPHNGTTTRLIWAHQNSAATFTWTGTTTTLAGTTLPSIATSWTGSSRFCLSCHDGTLAIGAISINGSTTDATVPAGTKVGASHQLATTGSLNGNHPVAIPYPLATTSAYNGVTTAVALADIGVAYAAAPTIVKLYGTGTNKGLECASCHDPHTGSAGEFFLRDVASTLCGRCHSGK